MEQQDLQLLAHIDYHQSFVSEAQIDTEFDSSDLAQAACDFIIQNVLSSFDMEEEFLDNLSHVNMLMLDLKKAYTLFTNVDAKYLDEVYDENIPNYSLALGYFNQEEQNTPVIGVKSFGESEEINLASILYGLACFLGEFLEDNEFDALLAIANVNITMNLLDQNKQKEENLAA